MQCIHLPLTDDDCQDDQNDDDEDYPQLHVLPPQLALQASRRTLEHVSILVEILWKGGGGGGEGMGGEWKGEGGERSEVQCRGGQRKAREWRKSMAEEKHGCHKVFP